MWQRTNWHGSRHSDPGSYSFQLRERGSQALRCPSLAKKPFWIFVRVVSIFTISRISILRKKLWFLELSWKCFSWWLLCNVTKYGASWSIGRYGDDPFLELAYVRTFKLTPYVYLFRHLFSIIWCIDHAWFHYYDFIVSKTKNNFSFFWMRWFFALAAISGLAQGETCVTLDSTRYYYRRMESNRAEILLRLEHDSSRNVLKLNHLSF